MLLELFIKYLKKHKIYPANEEKVIVTVSGGLDSMVLLHLFQKINVQIIVAHCNFKLRGEESESETEFVKNYCILNNLTFENIYFETEKFAKSQKTNTQLAAKELRYKWFEEIKTKHNAKYIATAHHANDQTETLFLNLLRASGPKGLRGIAIETNNIIRPLLFATKKEIHTYAIENQIEWKEDSSNKSNKYKRNYIRNQVIPIIEKKDPSIHHSFQKVSENMKDVVEFIDYFYPSIYQKISEAEKPYLEKINLITLEQYKFKNLIINELFSKYNFETESVNQLMIADTGAKIENKNFRIWKNRDYLLLEKKYDSNTESIDFIIKDDLEIDFGNYHLKTRIINKSEIDFKNKSKKIWFSMDVLNQNAKLRTYKTGDKISVFGGGFNKKISDIFIDNKIPQSQKNQIPILEIDKKIVWITGLQHSSHYTFKTEDKEVFEFEIITNQAS